MMMIQQHTFIDRAKRQTGLLLLFSLSAIGGVIYIVARPHGAVPSLFSRFETIEDSAYKKNSKPLENHPVAHTGSIHPSPVSIGGHGFAPAQAEPSTLNQKDAQKLLDLQTANNKKQQADTKKKADDKKKVDAAAKRKNGLSILNGQDPNANPLNGANGASNPAGAAASGSTPSYGSSLPAVSPSTNNDSNENDANKVSIAEWRAKLLGNPTATDLQGFVAAYSSHDVTTDQFYSVLHDMLHSSSTTSQSGAITMLNSVKSGSSFEFAVTESKATTTSSTNVSSLQTVITSYEKAPGLATLRSVLAYSTDPNILSAAITVIGAAFTADSQATAQSGTTKATQLATYLGFIPELQRITNASLSSQAQQLVSQIQLGTSSQAIATN